MDDRRYFEDFRPGETIDLGSYPELTEEEIVSFARRWDPQPFHVDPVAAKESIFGGLIASGWHTGAIAMRLLVDRVLSRSASQGSPGVEAIRFLRPVRPGARLSGRYTVLETVPSASRPGIGKVKSRIELVDEHGEVVLTITSTGFFDRREAPSGGDVSSAAGEG